LLLDGEKYARMIRQAAVMLAGQKDEIDALNVFPVPDGDTGTNMYLTMASAAKEVDRVSSSTIGLVAEAAARGSLMGARGNSGVILSQLLRGIAIGLKDMDQANPAVFADALAKGTEVAYRAVMKPVEGTILTVARGASEAAQKAVKAKKNAEEVLAAACGGARETLAETPKLLPVLAQSGVVDAGGKGWEVALNGFLAGAFACEAAVETPVSQQGNLVVTPALTEMPAGRYKPGLAGTTGLINKYCTELLVKGRDLSTETIRGCLDGLGDSLMVVGEDETVKVHLHTDRPGRVLEICIKYGELDQIKVDNMSLQQRQDMPDNAGKQVGTVVVAAGEGFDEILASLGADRIVSGGQTMNPSAEELARAIDGVPAENIIIMPNNGNIILTAQLARELSKKNVEVIPSRTVQQGVAALLAMVPDKDFTENIRLMQEGMRHVVSGEVTYAVRDSDYNDRLIKRGDILGIVEDEIRLVGQDVNAVTEELILSLLDNQKEVLTIYYGEGITAEQAGALAGIINEKMPQVEIEVLFGGQPLYYYLLSVE
jgi:DAK2 domain fusion protein YloV